MIKIKDFPGVVVIDGVFTSLASDGCLRFSPPYYLRIGASDIYFNEIKVKPSKGLMEKLRLGTEKIVPDLTFWGDYSGSVNRVIIMGNLFAFCYADHWRNYYHFESKVGHLVLHKSILDTLPIKTIIEVPPCSGYRYLWDMKLPTTYEEWLVLAVSLHNYGLKSFYNSSRYREYRNNLVIHYVVKRILKYLLEHKQLWETLNKRFIPKDEELQQKIVRWVDQAKKHYGGV